jgi:hypothetical protein
MTTTPALTQMNCREAEENYRETEISGQIR